MPEIATVFLSGTPAQMGFRHGRLLSGEIRSLLGAVHRHIFRRLGIPRGAGVRVLAHGFGLAMNRHLPPHLREEMRWVSEGSGVRYLDILLLNSLDDVLNILRRLSPRPSYMGCSSFALSGSRTLDGTLLHGRNLDYHFRGTPIDDGGAASRLLQSQATLFVCRPMGRAPFVSVGWPGIVGATTALSGEGISLGNLTSYIRGTTPNGVPSTILYRMVLEEARSLRQAEALLRASRRTIGNNLLIGSGGENSAALFEITRDSVARIDPDDGVLVSTNHFQSPDLARRQRPYLLPHSVARQRRLQDLCARQGIAVPEALAFLADVGCAGEEWAGNPFARVANEGTAVSVLFHPTAQQLWMGLSSEPPPSHGRFQRIDAAELMRRSGGD